MPSGAGGRVRARISRRPGNPDLPLPSPVTPGSAGHDLRAAVEVDVVIAPGDRALIPTGFSIALPEGYEGQVRPRSGLALEHGVVLPNAPGTIDADTGAHAMIQIGSHRRDAGGQSHVGTGAMADARARLGKQLDLLLVQVHAVDVPYVVAQPTQFLSIRHRPAAKLAQAERLLIQCLCQMRVKLHAVRTSQRSGLSHQIG